MVVADYCAQSMLRQCLLTGTIVLTASFVEYGLSAASSWTKLYFPEEFRIFRYFPVEPSITMSPYANKKRKRNNKERQRNVYLPALHMTTGSRPRFPLRSHSMVCTENHLFIVVIRPILNRDRCSRWKYFRCLTVR